MPSAIGGLLGGMATGRATDEARKQRTFENTLAQGRFDLQKGEQDRIQTESLMNRQATLLEAIPNLNPDNVEPWVQSVQAFNSVAPPNLQISTDTMRGGQPAAVPGLAAQPQQATPPPAGQSVPGLGGPAPTFRGLGVVQPSAGNQVASAPPTARLTSPSAVGASPPPRGYAARIAQEAAPEPAAPTKPLKFGSAAAEAKWYQDQGAAMASRAAVDAIDLAIREGKTVLLEATTSLGKKFGSYGAALQQPPTSFNAEMTQYVQKKMAEGWSYTDLLASGLQRVYDDYNASSQYASAQMTLRGKQAGDSLEWAKEVRANQDDFVETIILMTGGNFERGIEGLTANMNTDQAEVFNRLYGEGISAVAAGVNGRLQAAALLRQFGGQAGIPIDTELQPWAGETMDALLALGPMNLGSGNYTQLVDGQLFLHTAEGKDYLVTPDNAADLSRSTREGGVAGVPLKGKGEPKIPDALKPPTAPVGRMEGWQ